MKTQENLSKSSRKLSATICSLALLALLASGCASTGGMRSHNTDQLKKITKGQTTTAEVRQSLGKPSVVSRKGNGTEVWVYSSNNMRQKTTARGLGALLGNFAGYIPVPGATLVSTAGSAASMMATPPATTSKTTTIAFDSSGVVTSVNYDETSSE